VTDQAGTTRVLLPSPERLELVARNPPGERSNSTPAFSDGEIFIRTFDCLYCISQKIQALSDGYGDGPS
jgi:outer membrane protein assembly factor BamB